MISSDSFQVFYSGRWSLSYWSCSLGLFLFTVFLCTNQYLLWIRSLETALQPGAQGRPSPDLCPLLLGFLRTYRSCCPITLNVWHKNMPLQLRMLMKKGCGQSASAWENIVWCFAAHEKEHKDPVASVLLPSCRSVCVWGFRRWPCCKGKV